MEKLNYIGCKYSLLDFIEKSIFENTDVKTDFSLIDVFSGTSSVGYYFSGKNNKVISNDMEYYSYVVSYACVKGTYNKNVIKMINELNNLEPLTGIITIAYSPIEGNERKYFTIKNAQLIDSARTYLNDKKNELEDNDYYFLLASIIISSDKVANIPSVYGSYLKKFKSNSLKKFKVIPIHKREIQNNDNEIYNLECLDFMDEITNADIAYLDPPYNQRQYGKNYHVLNYIAKYSEDIEIYGKTGLLKDTRSSDWCKKKEAPIVLEKLLDKLKYKTKYVLLSYNNEGIIPFDKIKEVMEDKCENVSVVTKKHQRFKNFAYNKKGKTTEYIWIGQF